MWTRVVKYAIWMLPISYLIIVALQSKYFNPNTFEETPWIGSVFEHGHFILFGVLYVLIIYSWSRFRRIEFKQEIVVVIMVWLCSLSNEIFQYTVPQRSFSTTDLFKDSVGIFCAWLLCRALLRKGKKERKRKFFLY